MTCTYVHGLVRACFFNCRCNVHIRIAAASVVLRTARCVQSDCRRVLGPTKRCRRTSHKHRTRATPRPAPIIPLPCASHCMCTVYLLPVHPLSHTPHIGRRRADARRRNTAALRHGALLSPAGFWSPQCLQLHVHGHPSPYACLRTPTHASADHPSPHQQLGGTQKHKHTHTPETLGVHPPLPT